jgi:leader peptidase (prepilin peptidase) / N-methyltransferase
MRRHARDLIAQRRVQTRNVATVGLARAAPDLMKQVPLSALTVALLGVALAAASIWAVPGVPGMAGAGLALIMLAIAAIDLRQLIIPDELNGAALALGLVNAALKTPFLDSLAAAVLRAAVTLLLFWGIRFAYRRLRGRAGLGLGDVKLACVAGVWLDWPLIAIAVEIAALGALVGYGVLYLAGKSRPTAATRLPFGLFFAPAIWLSWLLGGLFLFSWS